MALAQLAEFTMRYKDRGGGDEIVVFVPGFVSTHRWWLPALELLPGTAYRAYAVDFRGAGGSERIDTGHTLAQYADDLDQFVTALGLPRFTLAGHSMVGGTAISWRF